MSTVAEFNKYGEELEKFLMLRNFSFPQVDRCGSHVFLLNSMPPPVPKM